MFAEDLKSYIKAGQPLLYVTALELPRAAYSIETICKSLNGEGYPFHEWKVTTGWDGTGSGDDPTEVFEWIDKFEDNRLVGFGKKIIYQESPETLPADMYKSIKREIAGRILSESKEKWWTCKEFYFECDNLREKYTNEKDKEKLKFLDQLNDHVMSIQKKYENA